MNFDWTQPKLVWYEVHPLTWWFRLPHWHRLYVMLGIFSSPPRFLALIWGEPMKCDYCASQCELIKIEKPRTMDYDNEGRVFWFCPGCFSIDNITLRENRYLHNRIIQNQSLFSNRVRKSVVHQLSKTITDDEGRKELIKDTMSKIRNTGDTTCFHIIAESFHIPTTSVVDKFFTTLNVKVYRDFIKSDTIQ